MAFVKEIKTKKDCYTSQEIKANIIAYLRFKRKLRALTEYSYCGYEDIDDIVAFSSDMKDIWCIEVKCSKQDFLQDFKTKRKWEIFDLAKTRESAYQDLFFTRMLFAVPKQLENFVIEYLKDKYPQVGVIVPTGKIQGYARIAKTPQIISSCPITRDDKTRKRLEKSFIDRMSSELALLYQREC